MFKNHSPWLDVPLANYASGSLTSDITTDVVIVGAGIAGVTTAYYILKNTNNNVLLLEANTVGSGATGHNAGFAVNTFETSQRKLIEQYGYDAVKASFDETQKGWTLLDEICAEIQTPYKPESMPAAIGFSDMISIVNAMKDYATGIEKIGAPWKFYISEKAEGLDQLPKELSDLYQLVPQDDVTNMLQVKNSKYIGALQSESRRRATLNTARFSTEVVAYLQQKFPERFGLYENSPVKNIRTDNGVEIELASYTVKATDVVICTNGYKNFTLNNKAPHWIRAIISNMSAFLTETGKPYSYAFFGSTEYKEIAYFYGSAIPFKEKYLHITGGDERHLQEDEQYDVYADFPEEDLLMYKKFLSETFGENIENFDYLWHGVMGYTTDGLRWVGKDKANEHLLFNLGCNGIGIIGAIAGAEKVSRIVNGETLPPSILDPR